MNPNFIYRLGSRPYAYELSGDELESVDLGSDDSRKFPKTVLSLPEDWESSNPLSYIDVKVGPKSFVTLTTGVNMIVGPTASGKTSFLNRIFARLSDVEDLDVNFVNYSEPTRDAVVDEVELANATALALLTKDPSVVLIDSWREYAYSHTAGATGKGGMDMGLFARLTHLDIAALKTDTIVVGVRTL